MKNNPVITASAPGKLLLMGDHAVVYGYPCLVTAVDERVFVTVSRTDDQVLTIDAPEVEVAGYRKPVSALCSGDLPRGAVFIETALANFFSAYGDTGGISVSTRSDFSSQYGFGSSSASTAAFLLAVATAFGRQLSARELFDLAYKTVLDVQGVGSGFDVAAAIWGGTLFFTGGGGVVEQVTAPAIPLVVGYTGVKADTASIVKDVAKKRERDPDAVGRIFDAIAKLVTDGKRNMEEGDWERFGTLTSFNQDYLRNLGVSSEKLESLIEAASGAGAWGAKLSGAGGGDCMIAVAADNARAAVEDAIRKAGGTVMDIKATAPGVRIEPSDDQGELFDVVDRSGKILGTRTRYECHHDKSLIHRTVGVLVYNSKRQLLLQKRSMTKDMEPGKWGISCAGHVAHGQTCDQAAVRELSEELGVTLPLTKLSELLIEQSDETELATLYTTCSDGPFELNMQEADEVMFLGRDELSAGMRSGDILLTEGAVAVLKHTGVLS